MNSGMKKKETDFVFVVPKKERPAKAFNKVAARAGFEIVQPEARIPDGRTVDLTGELPDIETRTLRCSDGLQRLRYRFAAFAIIGRDTFEEFNENEIAQGRPAVGRIVAELPVSECDLKVIVRNDNPAAKPRDLEGMRIATSYPAETSAWLTKQGVKQFEIIVVDGNVESFVKDGIADAGVDIVESGSSARLHGLRVTDMTLLRSSSLIVRTNENLGPEKEAVMECVVGRLTRAANSISLERRPS
jgi:ATP phosphoribosyltransferase